MTLSNSSCRAATPALDWASIDRTRTRSVQATTTKPSAETKSCRPATTTAVDSYVVTGHSLHLRVRQMSVVEQNSALREKSSPAKVVDEFVAKIFLFLPHLSGVLALNDLMAVYFPTFFLGLTSSLEAVILPREEHRLEPLLAKPVPAADFVGARTVLTLASMAAVGTTISFAAAVAIAVNGVAASVTPIGTLGGGLTLTGLAVVLVAALAIPFVLIRD